MPRGILNPTDKHVGSRLRMRRLMLDMSQTDVADALGLTFQQVQKYEKDANRIGASRLQHISQILQVPVPFFFEGPIVGRFKHRRIAMTSQAHGCQGGSSSPSPQGGNCAPPAHQNNCAPPAHETNCAPPAHEAGCDTHHAALVSADAGVGGHGIEISAAVHVGDLVDAHVALDLGHDCHYA